MRNLELFEPLDPDGKSLLGVIDRTVTPMGARLLRRWLQMPLRNPVEINKRLDVVEYFFRNTELRDDAAESLKTVGDLERLVSKVEPAQLEKTD